MVYKKLLILTLGLLTLILVALFSTVKSNQKLNNVQRAEATVMITNYAKNSGGTGVILASNEVESHILTNGHVCAVVGAGGLVITDDQQTYLVDKYKKSISHDLCLITVKSDLHVNTNVSNRDLYRYEDAVISGHPHLLPTVITTGHFSGYNKITVMIGVETCTEEQRNSPSTALLCALAGGLPIIKEFNSQVVTATIMPGSSGSAVYNSDGEISALVFAGSGDLSYAQVVPLEYIHKFLNDELKVVDYTTPLSIK